MRKSVFFATRRVASVAPSAVPGSSSSAGDEVEGAALGGFGRIVLTPLRVLRRVTADEQL